jgi:hypothetical protein
MKAQFWSFDIIFAVIIFVFAVVILTLIWINITDEFAISYGTNLARIQAQLQSLGIQLLSAGSPPNWNSVMSLGSSGTWENLSIGLGNGTVGGLSQQKINAFYNMSATNYQASKPPLGVAYDYYITVAGSGVNTVAIGMNPAVTNVTSVQVTTLPAVLNGKPVQVQIQLWTNSTLGIE